MTWRSHGSEASGEVVREITSDTRAAGRTVRASRNEPQYLVKSDREAVHKPAALRRRPDLRLARPQLSAPGTAPGQALAKGLGLRIAGISTREGPVARRTVKASPGEATS